MIANRTRKHEGFITAGAATFVAKTVLTGVRKTILFCFVLVVVVTAGMVAAPSAAGEQYGGAGAGVRTVYLVRHGHYDENDDRDPDVGKALVPLGIAQARLAAARLRSLPVKITALYSSTMTRARQTAAVIQQDFPDLELRQTRLLRECTPATWRKDIMDELEDGEAERCRDQLEKAFAEFFVPSPGGDTHDVLVCHGNVIRYFVTRVLGVDTMAWLGMSIGNCSLTAVQINPDGSMKLLFFGDVGHLPPNLQTRTGHYPPERSLVVPGE
jgi:serine/threonine-protein phosphatase PGAM5